MVGNAWVSNGAEEDRVKWPELLDTVCGHHLSGFDVSFATPVKRVPVEPESKALSCRFQHTNAFGHNFFPDAVACDDRDVESFHEATLYPFSADNNGESALTSGAESNALTKAIIFSALVFGHCAYSAHPRNFAAASSKVIGSAGAPFCKTKPAGTDPPSLFVIFKVLVIFLKNAPRASLANEKINLFYFSPHSWHV